MALVREGDNKRQVDMVELSLEEMVANLDNTA